MEFKGERATLYDNLEWAREPKFIDYVIGMGRFQKGDRVLDVGTGTGIMADAICPLVSEVVGLDISHDMLSLNHVNGNFDAVEGDIRKSGLPSESFDKVVARQVFHHILTGAGGAIDECYRLLRPGGLMVLAEGVPPSKEIKRHYKAVFALKEERVTFMEEDLENLLRKGLFADVQSISIWQRQMSIRNWLANSGLPQDKQDAIFALYPQFETLCKRAYNMRQTKDGDYLIDMKQVIVVGKKRR
ncbi:hypothetical protein LCGC14_0933010 [marine sediment metagenome]|uniref:Methyltransferase type 11 domain-containing protein n=2 Tax=marine sediment metagenome TaxID=412755 RepID=A0A0F9NS12_9ZZZZ